MGSASELSHVKETLSSVALSKMKYHGQPLAKRGFLYNDIERVEEEPVLSLTILQRVTSN